MLTSPMAPNTKPTGTWKKVALSTVIFIAVCSGVTYVVIKSKNNHEYRTAIGTFQSFKEHVPKLPGTPIYQDHFTDTNGDRGIGKYTSLEPSGFANEDESTLFVAGSRQGFNYAEALFKQFAASPDWSVESEKDASIDASHKHYNFMVTPNDKRCQNEQCFFLVSLDQYDSAASLKSYDGSTGGSLAEHFTKSTLPVYGYSLDLQYFPK